MLKIGKRLLSRYHPSRLCKGIRQSFTPPPSTQVRIIWRQPQNQQMDSLLPREQKTERYTWRDCLQASSSTLWCTPMYSSWTSTGMPETATSSETKLFADDSLLYRTIHNQTDSNLLQRDLTTLENWENKWQMSFNAKNALSSE